MARAEDESPTTTTDDNAKESSLNLASVSDRNNQLAYSDMWKAFKYRVPYWLEEKFGVDMSFYISRQIPSNLLTGKIREAMKNNNIADVKAAIFTGE